MLSVGTLLLADSEHYMGPTDCMRGLIAGLSTTEHGMGAAQELVFEFVSIRDLQHTAH